MPFHQSRGHFNPSGFEYSSHGLPGNIHDISSLALIHSGIVYETDRFKLFQGKDDVTFGIHPLGPE